MANDINIRRDDKLLCGRLVALPTSRTPLDLAKIRDNAGFRNVTSIDFPAMPDAIELARSTDYLVNSNMVLPDGMHQYRSTKPLEIPLSFKLHFDDDQYCKKGALTLLQLAARLHSFVLPVSTFQRGVTVAPRASNPSPTPQNGQGKGLPKAAQLEQNSSHDQIFDVQRVSSNRNGSIFSPVTCWLHLMWIGNDQPGVSCVGYVKDVKVVFSKPWLRGINGSFNLPTWAEYSFTFMHRPGHNNNFGVINTNEPFPQTLAETPQTFADDVKDKLYNTRSLVYAANYQGFSNGQFTQNAP